MKTNFLSPERNISISQWKQHKDAVITGLDRIDPNMISDAVELLLDAAKTQQPMFVAGNGASAALSQHWACDLLKGSSGASYSNHVISLSSNMALITAIGNDYGYEQIFTEQLKRHTTPYSTGIVILISASGKSPNIVHIAEFVKHQRKQMQIISLTGFHGEPLRSLSTVNLHVPVHEYEAVEDVHNALMHTFAKSIRDLLK